MFDESLREAGDAVGGGVVQVPAMNILMKVPVKAAAGTIRGDLARDWGEKVQKNIVHGSDSSESAEREIGIWFA